MPVLGSFASLLQLIKRQYLLLFVHWGSFKCRCWSKKKIRMWYLDSNKDSSMVNYYLVCLHHCLSLVRWLTCKHVYPQLHYDPPTQKVSGEYEYGHFVFFRPAVQPEVRRPDGWVKCLNYQPHPVRFEMFHPMLL